MFRPTATDVNGLRVLYHGQGRNGQKTLSSLPSDSLNFKCIASAASFALDLLESQNSIRVLRGYTTDLALGGAPPPRTRNWQRDQDISLVREFFQIIRASFPHILITTEHGMKYRNGMTNKRDCGDPFITKTSALIELNGNLITALVDVCDTARSSNSRTAHARFQTLLCRIGITLAHEVVHIYTLFLFQLGSQHTPPRFSSIGYGDDDKGEAGRYWERKVFGGFVDMRLSSGLEVLALRCGPVCRMRAALITGLLKRDFTWLDELLTDPGHEMAREAVERMDEYKWDLSFKDFFPKKPTTISGPVKLTEAQRDELMGPTAFRLPQFSVCGSDLRAFARDPRAQVQVRAV